CVKNVLNGIEGGLFIAKRGLEANVEEKIAKGWDMLERNASFLKTLVLDMLDYSKQRPPEYEDVSISGLIAEITDFVGGRAAKEGIDLVVDIGSAVDNVRLDPTRMKRALLNIVANAIEATDEGGRVSVVVTPKADTHLLITISDTGKGIPEDKLDTIFEPFFSTKGSKGTGLGLPVTKKIVEEHKGKIEVESQVGKGTTFRITLPLRQS
ncbi:MAG TPA: HAMP domain-containing histidine kinase, partial [Firmicutes bacterium]|nr:HAMP domain-containing histidine kinase [Bacillota bacterium]